MQMSPHLLISDTSHNGPRLMFSAIILSSGVLTCRASVLVVVDVLLLRALGAAVQRGVLVRGVLAHLDLVGL